MATAVAPSPGDLVLLDNRPTDAHPASSGLYVVLSDSPPYQVASAIAGGVEVPLYGALVPQNRIVAVYRAAKEGI